MNRKNSGEFQYVRLDLKKIFLTPPTGKRERTTLVVVMTLVFMLYFGPLTFSEVHPVRAILVSAVSTLPIAWAWIVLLRFVGQKEKYSREDDG